MKKDIISFLKEYTTDTFAIDRLIVSAFLLEKNINSIQNTFLVNYLISENDQDFAQLQKFKTLWQFDTIEDIIKIFEFVVSPSDKIVNGAVYTPKAIREYIVANCIERYNGNNIEDVLAADIACGCGGFLLTFAQALHIATGKTYTEIFNENIFGIDIAEYSIQRTKILLSLLAVLDGENTPEFNFNLFTGNSLDFNWSEASLRVLENRGFDIIVGNPPYVCSRNMLPATLQLLERWEVSRTGHPDLYIPFFQIGLEQLNRTGILGYITVNTFIKSINGRALREYFARNNTDLTIISFGGEQLFPERNTYTCICFLSQAEPGVMYIRTQSSELANITLNQLNHFNYQDLDHHDGWNLVNDQNIVAFINQVESVGRPFKEIYDTKNGIATLKNDVYKFKPIRKEGEFYFLADGGWEYPIEVGICRDIVNANKVRTDEDFEQLREKIIFPYNEKIEIIPENEMARKFPSALAYLTEKKKILAQRDKGEGEYEAWYAYGRRQSMDIHAYKLFFPHICSEPVFTICEDEDLLFYNGIAIVSEDLEELLLIKKILESRIFTKYIKNTTKDYASGYISMSRNYLKNFGVYQFNEEEREDFLNMDDYDAYLERLYGVNV